MEQQTGSKLGKEYIKAVDCHPAYVTSMQSTSSEIQGWMTPKLESRFLGEISITSYLLKPFPPPSSSHPSGSSQCTSPEHSVSCIEPGLVICFTYDNIHVSTLFSQIIQPSLSPTESKRLFYTSVSLFPYICNSILYWCFSF